MKNIFPVLLMLISLTSNAEITYQQMNKEFQETKNDDLYKLHTKAWVSIFNQPEMIAKFDACDLLDKNDDTVLFELNKDGYVLEALSKKETLKANCFIQVFESHQHPKPPYLPFIRKIPLRQ